MLLRYLIIKVFFLNIVNSVVFDGLFLSSMAKEMGSKMRKVWNYIMAFCDDGDELLVP
jgi:hypothetical protein